MARANPNRRRPAPRNAPLSPRAGVAARERRRTDMPVAFPGATRFSDDRSALNARWAPEVLQRNGRVQAIWNGFREGTTFAPERGKPRDPGSYALAALVFADSKQVDVEPWWKETNDADWQEWGFTRRPGYNTVMERFAELE